MLPYEGCFKLSGNANAETDVELVPLKRNLSGPNDVAAAGADEPVAAIPSDHHFEVVVLHAIWTANGLRHRERGRAALWVVVPRLGVG